MPNVQHPVLRPARRAVLELRPTYRRFEPESNLVPPHNKSTIREIAEQQPRDEIGWSADSSSGLWDVYHEANQVRNGPRGRTKQCRGGGASLTESIANGAFGLPDSAKLVHIRAIATPSAFSGADGKYACLLKTNGISQLWHTPMPMLTPLSVGRWRKR